MRQSEELRTRTEKAFEFAKEAATLLVTLATGVLALTVTFSEQVLQVSSEPAQTIAGSASQPLVWSWLLYGASILCGLWVLLAMAGSLGRDGREPGIYHANIRIPSFLQVLTFLGGTGMLVWAGTSGIGALLEMKGLCPIWPIC